MRSPASQYREAVTDRARTAAETIADLAIGLSLDDVPRSATLAAKWHMLDGFGCAIAAARSDAVFYAVNAALKDPAPEQATIIGEGRRVATASAALANGALIHGLDFDDTHEEALVHATAAVLPAAFAVAEERHRTGSDMLAAAIAGYEVVIRLGSAIPHAFHRRGLHATSVCGVFASAIIASRLMGLHPDQAANALGIAGSMAAGSLEFLHTGSSTKQLHPGLSAMNGIVAARLAAEGAEGPSTVFEGEHGLYRMLAGQDVDPAALTDGFGTRWDVERIAIKHYPACQLSHATFDALLNAQDIDATDIERVVVHVPDGSIPIVCEPAATKIRPRTAYEAKFSLQWSAAALLIDGGLTPGTYDKLDRPEVEALAAKIECRATSFDGPPARAPGDIEITLQDGRVLRRDATRDGAARPDALRAKLRSNCGPLDADALERVVMGIDEAATMENLAAALDLRGAK